MDTDQAMEALTEIVAELHDRRETLTALEWRKYAWARASLAVLTAIRVEEMLAKVNTSDYPVTS